MGFLPLVKHKLKKILKIFENKPLAFERYKRIYIGKSFIHSSSQFILNIPRIHDLLSHQQNIFLLPPKLRNIEPEIMEYSQWFIYKIIRIGKIKYSHSEFRNENNFYRNIFFFSLRKYKIFHFRKLTVVKRILLILVKYS